MNLTTIDFQSSTAPEQFVNSLRHTGFAVLTNHPIKKESLESIYSHWQQFFNSEQKELFRFNPKTQDGFFPATVSETAKGATVKDIKEFYHYYPWGQVPKELKEEVDAYYKQTSLFAETLLSWVEAHSPIEVAEKFSIQLSEMIAKSEDTLLRILHYPPMLGTEEPGAIRAAAHEDINLLTILPAANEPGLQVLKKDGTWLDVPCDFGNLIINTGDMLQEASQGYFPSTTHRVINPTGEAQQNSRISLPLFLHPHPDVRLSDNYTAGEYLTERLKELGLI
ncbi:isopenicillin N synthase family oxygenase [Vibrio sp. SS-MA-C1-2]|uniref:isopenicillin N synthase family dioxygenase n=1 Tax=Vibrio sp. SS-MA-C1-2 TaxID=2908646 RepID=UPI001F1D1749|nr:2OG-Fe(II) oxygenase family protein [Vibrio sp. SS-MA-C1-2]UJF18294.1 isopenicillin N synthase family oxygenase [Vibrio sp. SS-MA-C1-2]